MSLIKTHNYFFVVGLAFQILNPFFVNKETRVEISVGITDFFLICHDKITHRLVDLGEVIHRQSLTTPLLPDETDNHLIILDNFFIQFFVLLIVFISFFSNPSSFFIFSNKELLSPMNSIVFFLLRK